MNNIYEKREVICVNCPDYKISSVCLLNNGAVDCVVDGKSCPLSFISTLDDMNNKSSSINNLSYRLYNDFDKTFIELYNSLNHKKFVHQIINNTLSMPFEIKATITIKDYPINSFNMDATICFIPNSFESSWFDVADGISLLQVDIKVYEMSFHYKNEKFNCKPYVGAYQYQIKNSQIVMQGDNRRHPLFVWFQIFKEAGCISMNSVLSDSKSEIKPMIPTAKVKPTLRVLEFPDIAKDYIPPKIKVSKYKQPSVLLYTENIIRLPKGPKYEKPSVESNDQKVLKQSVKKNTVINSFSPKFLIPSKPSKVSTNNIKNLPFKKSNA